MTLIPSYTELDFNTIVEKLKEELASEGTFKDYDYRGSNISVLIELMAYFGDLSAFFLNKIAKNVYLESSDIYEVINRLARQIGYEPKGTRSARVTLSCAVSGYSSGDTITVLPWKKLNSGRQTSDGDPIYYSTTSTTSTVLTDTYGSVSVPLRQGEVVNITGYTGADLIDNELVLPSNYAYDNDIDDDYPSIEVIVNNDIWERVSDFYDSITPLSTDDVYMFVYDRYERSKIVFNTTRNVPEETDTITIKCLRSLSTDGSIAEDTASDTWTIVDTVFAQRTKYGYSTPTNISNDLITLSTSAASIGASDPETINEVKANAQSTLRTQFRNVTASDYKTFLTERSDISAANAWGEQDIVPSAGSILEYNKVHLSAVPTTWSNSTIVTSAGVLTTDWSTSGGILVPLAYSSTWTDTLNTYLQPRKMISVYEVFDLPELVYFSFEFSCRIKRLYAFLTISNDIKNKLIYYFRKTNHEFGEIINFNNILEYILDTTQISPTDNFEYIVGVRNLNMRDINLSVTVNDYDSSYIQYPYWADSEWTLRDNTLRRIQLGYNQFPILESTSVSISQES